MHQNCTDDSGHILEGVWVASESSVHYTIVARGASFEMSAVDSEDGEQLQISAINWEGKVLRFTSDCPSTEWRLDHVLEVTSQGVVEHRYTRKDTGRTLGGVRIRARVIIVARPAAERSVGPT
jgi:hypothetical protein